MRDRYKRLGWAWSGQEWLSVIGSGCSESGMSVRFRDWACGLGNDAEDSGMRWWGLQKVTVVTVNIHKYHPNITQKWGYLHLCDHGVHNWYLFYNISWENMHTNRCISGFAWIHIQTSHKSVYHWICVNTHPNITQTGGYLHLCDHGGLYFMFIWYISCI